METSTLTAGQRAMLESDLLQRQQSLQRRLDLHLGGNSRTEHARDLLQQDGDDAPQRDSDREVDQALTDLEVQALASVNEALRRLPTPAYGLCERCGVGIAVDRLRAEPDARRCIACETAVEGGAAI
jgi:DnaK suppressor protein